MYQSWRSIESQSMVIYLGPQRVPHSHDQPDSIGVEASLQLPAAGVEGGAGNHYHPGKKPRILGYYVSCGDMVGGQVEPPTNPYLRPLLSKVSLNGMKGSTPVPSGHGGHSSWPLTLASESKLAGSAGTATSTGRVSTAITPTGMPPSLQDKQTHMGSALQADLRASGFTPSAARCVQVGMRAGSGVS